MVKYHVQVTPKGHFEISEENKILAEGLIGEGTGILGDIKRQTAENGLSVLQADDIYTALRIRGYDYGPQFQGLQTYFTTGKIQFMYLLMQFQCYMHCYIMFLVLILINPRAPRPLRIYTNPWLAGGVTKPINFLLNISTK